MADRAIFEAELPGLVKKILDAFASTLVKDDGVEDLFTEQSKLTIDKRVQSGADITKHLKRLCCEFRVKTYTFISTKDDQIVITGQCLWGNAPTAFTMVLDVNMSTASIKIANLIIFPAKA